SERFLREARAATSLRHPNIGEVLFLGEAQETYFYTVEYVSGETLASRIRRSGSVGTVEALMIVEQVAVALIALEEGNVLHRDIKPGRISMRRSDEGELKVKLIDFGLVKNLLPDEASATWKSMIGYVEAPAFSSPEQLQYKPLDTRSDIYSLGVTLWYALAGELPFKGRVDEVISGHMRTALPMEQLADQPEVARSLVGKMLEKDRAHRHASAADLHREILTCLEVISAEASQSAKKEMSGRNKTREEKERLFSEAVARAEQAAKTKRLAEQEQKQKEADEEGRQEQEQREKARLTEKNLDRERAEKEQRQREAALKQQQEKKAEEVARRCESEALAAEIERTRQENVRLESEAREVARQKAAAKKEAEQELIREEAAERKQRKKERREQEAKARFEKKQKQLEKSERKEREHHAAAAAVEAKKTASTEEGASQSSWKPVRTRNYRRPLVIVLAVTVVLISLGIISAVFFRPKAIEAPPAPNYFSATVMAWRAGDHKSALTNFNRVMENDPDPEKFTMEFKTFLQQVLVDVGTGKLGEVAEAATRWETLIALARETDIEDISEALVSIDREQSATVAVELWEKGDREGTALVLADYFKTEPDPQSLPAPLVELLGQIVESLSADSPDTPGVIGNEWEAALAMVAAREGSPGNLLLLADSIYSRDPSAAYPYYRDLLKREPKGEGPARIRFCLSLLDRYPNDEGSFFRNELEKEFTDFFAGNDVISTEELLHRIPLEDWQRSAEQGVIQALYRLGQIYSSRELDSIEQDDALALEWFEKAAAEGLLSAKYSAAWMNINGRGIKITIDKARAKGFAILATATETERKDLPKFSYQLAICYEKGIGIDADPAKAKQFYEEALKLFRVKYEADELSYFRGYSLLLAKGGEWEKVGEVLQAGAERNDPASQLMLGSLYFDDKLESSIRRDSGIEHDPVKGEGLIIRAAKGGDSLAMKTCRKYGWIYK
ncbi:MAG: protein kinase, partial [Verrucomicrobia bacterium]|nr:protein kinase [Verrucomicrobiota bacterium]